MYGLELVNATMLSGFHALSPLAGIPVLVGFFRDFCLDHFLAVGLAKKRWQDIAIHPLY